MRKSLILVYILTGVVVLALGLMVGLYLASKSSKQPSSSPSPQMSFEEMKISLDDLKKKMDKGEDFILLDNRSFGEYQEKHIPGASSMPLSEIDKKYQELSKDKEIITYCHGWHCNTSKIAAQKLKDYGFEKVRILDGTVSDWEKRGWPIEKGSQ